MCPIASILPGILLSCCALGDRDRGSYESTSAGGRGASCSAGATPRLSTVVTGRWEALVPAKVECTSIFRRISHPFLCLRRRRKKLVAKRRRQSRSVNSLWNWNLAARDRDRHLRQQYLAVDLHWLAFFIGALPPAPRRGCVCPERR